MTRRTEALFRAARNRFADQRGFSRATLWPVAVDMHFAIEAEQDSQGVQAMLVVLGLGGKALLPCGEPMTPENQRAQIRVLAKALAPTAAKHQIVVAYGNGPEPGLLALEAVQYAKVEAWPVDILTGQAELTTGYMLQQELGSLLPPERPFAAVLMTVEVDPADPAFKSPTTFVGPVYLREEAARLAHLKDWTFKADGDKWRRVVASVPPKRFVELRPIRWLLEHGTAIIVAGGGGIPTMRVSGPAFGLAAADCVVPPDLAFELLARELGADVFVMLTDADAVYVGWETPSPNAIRRASPESLAPMSFCAESMGSKVAAACRFATATGNRAAIGTAADLEQILAGTAGTTISTREAGVTHAEPAAVRRGGRSESTWP